jgi:hypothetical protein
MSFVLLAAVGRAGAPPSGAGAGPPVRIQWNAPAGCSEADAFFAGVQSRAERVRRSQSGEAALRLEVRLERTSGFKVHGELRMTDDRGRFELRKVDGRTCDEVVDALSLTAALALGASGVVVTPSAPAAAGGALPTGGAAPSPRSPPVAGPGSAPDEAVRPPPAPPVAPAAVSPLVSPPPLQPSRPSPDVVQQGPPPEASPGPPGDGPPDSAPEPRRGGIGVGLGLGPIAGEVSTPAVDLGGTALLRVGPRRDEGEPLRWSVGLSATHLRNDWVGAAPEVAISWTAVALTACPGWGIDVRLVIEACATTAVGRLRAADRLVSVSTPATRGWWSVGPVLRARLALGSGFTLLVDATAHLPLYRRTFVTLTPEETVAQTPKIAGMFGVVLAREL